MMRWLKDKKRGEKRASGPGTGAAEEAGKEEDDYGFEKEKTPNKSPVTKRQLPPTPAAPEERSTHIYEEIPDLHVSCTPEHERTSLLKNKKAAKTKSPFGNHNHNHPHHHHHHHNINNNNNNKGHNHNSKQTQGDKSTSGGDSLYTDDSISPYMVVPVDEQVRQTPPHFHRDGTPEVHCDVIVKETHCEILLTRKPKVGAFRLDSSALTGSENSVGASRVIRNNTHFCSLNRRASVDVQAGAGAGAGVGGPSGSDSKSTSAFSWSSSAFSSASTSKVNSVGTSSMSLSTLPEHRLHGKDQALPASVPEGDSAGGSSGSSAKGVTTYSTGGNFIPRSTKLVFKPLTPLDPDFFDDPDQDVNLRNAERLCNGQMLPNSSSSHLQSPLNDDESIEYTSVQGHMKPESDSPVVYSAIQNDQLYGAKQMAPALGRGQCEPSSPPPSFQDSRHCTATGTEQNPFRSTLVRSYSPSSSSSCTYASVNFPPESRVYNTIQDVNMGDVSATTGFPVAPPPCTTSPHGDGDSVLSSYSSGQFESEGSRYPGKYPYRIDLPIQNAHFQAHPADGAAIGGKSGLVGLKSNADGAIYAGVSTPRDFGGENAYTCIDAPKADDPGNHTTSSLLQNKLNGQLILDFCRCRDYNQQQYSFCGCPDLKSGDDDDNASVSTTTNDLKGSCGGCGRLIKQITYSESYSDETYEHAYSSRLLLRKGRRFSSPDITMSEISASESQDPHAVYSGSPFGTMSRDDMWSRPQNCDVRSTFYRPERDMDSSSAGQFNPADHPVVLNAREQASKGIQIQNDTKMCEEKSVSSKQRKSFSAFSSNDVSLSPKPDTGKPPGFQHLKRTSLPLAATPSPSMNVDARVGKTSAVAQLQPKSSAFSGLFSKFSRTKTKAASCEEEVSEKGQQTSSLPAGRDVRIEGDARMALGPDKTPSSTVTANPIPEKNTQKLSKFFQRLSSKDTGNESQGKSPQPFSDWERKSSKAFSEDERTEEYSRRFMLPEVQQDHKSLSKLDNDADTSSEVLSPNPNAKHNQKPPKIGDKSLSSNDSNAFTWTKSSDTISGKSNLTSMCRDLNNEEGKPTNRRQPSASSSNLTASGTEESNSCLSPAPDAAGSKVKSKTDSGDTCYEYDISTSSESEQTSYDYFLSKVKKSLNLEKEVQHIADMNALRKRLLCKICKKDGGGTPVSSDHGDLCLMDGACSHEPSFKCSDWRKFFGEVDQRTVILNCLSDFAHSPYSAKGDGVPDLCRECGGEIVTSDSESLTTVYSILSQHLRMTSPETRTPSCDSDEGTMADNSGESGDEEVQAVGEGEADSSGFDDDDVIGLAHNNVTGSDAPRSKGKKREKLSKEKREKKSFSHSSLERARRRNQWSVSKTDLSGHQNNKSDHPSGVAVDSMETSQGSTRHRIASRRSSTGGGKACSIINNSNNILNNNNNNNNSSSFTNLSTSPAANSGGSEFQLANDNKESSSPSDESKKNPDLTTRTKSSLLATDKAIQDIYAPLPSRALSWLTARNGGGQRSNSCACHRNGANTSGESQTKASLDTPTAAKMTSSDVAKDKAATGDASMGDQKSSSSVDVAPTKTNKDAIAVSSYCEDVSFSETKSEAVDNVVEESGEKTQSPGTVMSNKATRSGPVDPQPSTHVPPTLPSKEPKQSPSFSVSRRRSRQLPLAALDLLPETALGGDVPEEDLPGKNVPEGQPSEAASNIPIPISIPKESPNQRLVERMARLFEGNGLSAATKDKSVRSNSNSNSYDVTPPEQSSTSPKGIQEAQTDKIPPKKQKAESKRPSGPRCPGDDNVAKTHTLTLKNQGRVSRHARTSSLGISQKSLSRTRTLSNPNIHENGLRNDDPDFGQNQMGSAPKTGAMGQGDTKKESGQSPLPEERKSSRRNATTTTTTNNNSTNNNNSSSNSSHRANPEGKSKRRDSSARRQMAPPSPGSSSSSSSPSSSPSRRRNSIKGGGHSSAGQGRQKRLSKKSHQPAGHKSRARTTERKKKKKREGGAMKEEKTYYCFSSDMSDIDVVEMDEFDPYAGQRSVSESRRSSGRANQAPNTASGKEYRHRKDRSASKGRLNAHDGGKKSHVTSEGSKSGGADRKSTQEQKSNDDGGDDYELVQEVYSMPPNSSEVCEVKGHRDESQSSPSVSPDLQKLRKKFKRTDIYRTKRSNNRLLSDLIIRNYDRQVFGNV